MESRGSASQNAENARTLAGWSAAIWLGGIESNPRLIQLVGRQLQAVLAPSRPAVCEEAELRDRPPRPRCIFHPERSAHCSALMRIHHPSLPGPLRLAAGRGVSYSPRAFLSTAWIWSAQEPSAIAPVS